MSNNISSILVTGASGFVGVNIVKYLVTNGNHVLATTRNPKGPDPLVRDYLEGYENLVDWVTVDLTHKKRVMDIVEKFDIDGVIHAAVFTAVTRDVEQKRAREILESNLMGTINTLELAREAGANRYVYVSSSGLYGSTNDPDKPVPESSPDPYLKMSGFYSITKIASEKLVERYSQLFDMTTTSMRIAAPYGNMERPTGSRYLMGPIYRLLHLILTEKKDKLRVKGLNYVRDWTFVMDTAKCLLAGLKTPPPISQLYNASCGVNSSLKEILKAIQDVPGIEFEWTEVEEDRNADFLVQVGRLRGPLSIKKSEKELKFYPDYNLKQGVKAYCEWWKKVTNKELWPPSRARA